MPADISEINIGVFTDTPHGDVSDDQFVAIVRSEARRTAFGKSKTLRDLDWTGKVVIDAGCGAGLKAFPMALRGATVYGIDGSDAQIKRARHYAKILDSTATFTQSWLETLSDLDLPKPDLIINSANIHHVEKWQDVIYQFAQVIKPGGHLYLTWGDPTLSLGGFIIKNQIAYRLGWDRKSRTAIGRTLFGWWDRNRNKQNVRWDSFFADLYAAYYRPIPAGRMQCVLKDAGFDVIESLPPMNAASLGRNAWLARLGKLGDAIVRLRFYFRFRHGPRVFVCVRR